MDALLGEFETVLANAVACAPFLVYIVVVN